MSNSIDIDDLASAITQEMKNYTEDVSEGIEKEALKTANEARDELKQTSPKNTGEYADGWSRKKTGRGDEVGHTVYNKEKPQLTHLLEDGHLNRDGSRTPGQKHIEPVEEKYNQLFEKRVEEIIKKGGE
ncbi:Bacteriophage HK97-gp10, putative tail-component [Orenia metallireducens]|uniref:Bacteriophage HK97-gp10, putative tail-component n=1 Tax=Orenia metallireducens TaxID=1413210 RepID=A0A285G7N3_9FIRM|nr:HK97 gp10 family phage protein [Orenia metallireducens]SNY19408.1 Bacteriophage HK97-gp10, putative tail-component [Orenia metallireducens]